MSEMSDRQLDSFPEPTKSVKINLEPLNEHQIVEVTNDGQEVYKAPSTFAEHFSKILCQVDFSPSNDMSLASKDSSTTDTDFVRKRKSSSTDIEEDSSDNKNSKVAIANVRSKIHNALTEVGVLFDVLNLAKDRKFLCVDLCSSQLGNSIDSSFGNNSSTVATSSGSQNHSTSFLAVAKRQGC